MPKTEHINGKDLKSGKSIWLIAENHSVEEPHLVQFLTDMLDQPMFKDAMVYVESANDYELAYRRAYLPTMTPRVCVAHVLPPNRIHTDARRFRRLGFWELMVNLDSFNGHQLWTKNQEATHEQEKAFEKNFFAHWNTKVKMIHALKRMCFADALPTWYTAMLNELKMAHLPNPITTRWKALPKKERQCVVRYFKEAVTLYMGDHVPLSIAFANANASRRTPSPNFVVKKYDRTLLEYFHAMNEVIMDVYVLVEILHHRESPWIFVGGYEHAFNIAPFSKGGAHHRVRLCS
jgi:hypothetical protein